MVNFKLRGDSHVCEVQICHEKLLAARASLPGHAIYGRVRNAAEMIEKMGVPPGLASLYQAKGWKMVGRKLEAWKGFSLGDKNEEGGRLLCLDLRGQGLSDGDVRKLVSAFPLLQTLNLKRNSIGPDGGKAIGAALEKNATLQTLNLEQNKIGDERFAVIEEGRLLPVGTRVVQPSGEIEEGVKVEARFGGRKNWPVTRPVL